MRSRSHLMEEKGNGVLHILQSIHVYALMLSVPQMIEGCPPFSMKQEIEVAKAYVANERPPFSASQKLYAHGLRELIEDCWEEQPSKRLTFQRIIIRLEEISRILLHRRRWKACALNFFQKLKAILKFDHSNSKSRSSRPTV
ncbi:hypothetical protein MTR67_032858 [Solanum verrucosum]|uniref:Serine-threonine/tyrosine-protein kinase catalytic domain-containing protein n=1 Tax=Solanum verrucosum TaxID=315347 RepID=A0AAF0U516_SOLVR|nr:hypothetical protein MTR67_032858 [Solanum verrucosum]